MQEFLSLVGLDLAFHQCLVFAHLVDVFRAQINKNRGETFTTLVGVDKSLVENLQLTVELCLLPVTA